MASEEKPSLEESGTCPTDDSVVSVVPTPEDTKSVVAAHCPAPCLNGGVCSSSGKCTCTKGFTGSQCQKDVDECVTEKPCAQLCRNIVGGYECYCRAGFQLQPDGESCRKNDGDGTAFEARDLENDYGSTFPTTRRPASQDEENEVGDGSIDRDYEFILKRLTKLESQVARGREREAETTNMSAKINLAIENIDEMRKAVESVERLQHEVREMKVKLSRVERASKMVPYLTNQVQHFENALKRQL